MSVISKYITFPNTPNIGDVFLCHYNTINFGSAEKKYHYTILIKKVVDIFIGLPCTSQKKSGKAVYKTVLYKITKPPVGKPNVNTGIILSSKVDIKDLKYKDDNCMYCSKIIPTEFPKILNAYEQFIRNSQNKQKRK